MIKFANCKRLPGRVAIDWGILGLEPCPFRPLWLWRLKPTSLLDREDGLECSSTSVTTVVELGKIRWFNMVLILPSTMVKMGFENQWIGFCWEHLHRKPWVFTIKSSNLNRKPWLFTVKKRRGFRFQFSHHPMLWTKRQTRLVFWTTGRHRGRIFSDIKNGDVSNTHVQLGTYTYIYIICIYIYIYYKLCIYIYTLYIYKWRFIPSPKKLRLKTRCSCSRSTKKWGSLGRFLCLSSWWQRSNVYPGELPEISRNRVQDLSYRSASLFPPNRDENGWNQSQRRYSG